MFGPLGQAGGGGGHHPTSGSGQPAQHGIRVLAVARRSGVREVRDVLVPVVLRLGPQAVGVAGLSQRPITDLQEEVVTLAGRQLEGQPQRAVARVAGAGGAGPAAVQVAGRDRPHAVALGMDVARRGPEPGSEVEAHIDAGWVTVDVLDASQQREGVRVGWDGERLPGLDPTCGQGPSAAPDE